jgi:hypothetical protein
MVDVSRLRPLIVVVLALLTLVPSFIEMATQGLSPILVLARLAQALALFGTLVWLVTGVVLHYARIQAGTELAQNQDREDTQQRSQF